GAMGLVQIDSDDDVSPGSASAGIPVLSIASSAGKSLRKAVVEGETVNVTLVDTREPLEAMSDIPCQGGMAGPFECDGIDLLAFVPAEEFDGAGQSDLWGWTDPDTGDEYVMMGKTNGTALFRVTDPTSPVYLGEVPNPGIEHAVWHDIKVYADHAFIVSESDLHGMLVFDLTRLRDVGDDEPQQFTPDATYPLNYSAHNIAINEDTGFAYIVGGNAGSVVPDQCLSGLHIVDINDPQVPRFAGCYARDGGPGTAARTVGERATDVSPVAYVHDTQCVTYRGPDERYSGQEVCFNASENKVTVVDVTNKQLPMTLGSTGYEAVSYAHQGWLTEDHAFLLVNDELDVVTEGNGVDTTRTIVLDVRDLEDPKVHFIHDHGITSSAHNNYVHEGLVYQSNYGSGLRVLDVAAVGDEEDPRLEPVAFFDVFPFDDADPSADFNGTWSNYPYFSSGTIAVSGRQEGLFLVRLAGVEDVAVACANCPVEIRAGESGTAEITVTNDGDRGGTFDIAVGGVPDDWVVDVAPQPVVVPAGETRVVTVTITVPRRERAGSWSLSVTATSLRDSGIHDSADVPVEVVKGRPSTAASKPTL
ncbi:MAG: choice-of-anchor B family protein, partial [Actinomycetota bacterium]